MRIAFVSPLYPSPADPFRAAYNYKLVESLRKLAEVEVFSPRAETPLRRSLRSIRVGSHHSGAGKDLRNLSATHIKYPSLPLLGRPLNSLACQMRLLPFLSESKPDLIFACWVHPEGHAALRVGRRLGVPVVVQAIGTDLRRELDPFARRFTRETMALADGVVTVSRELKAWAIHYGADPANVYPVLNGCDPTVFHVRSRNEMRRNLKLPPQCELILFVGSLIPAKGVMEFLEAALALCARRPHLHATIIGAGMIGGGINLNDTIQSRVGTSGCADRFHIPGPVSAIEIGEWMGASNLLSLPSYSEGCPNVVIEALSCGRPVVATNVGGIPELVDESTGILIEPRDVPALTNALESALDRKWDENVISQTAGRTWDQCAEETFAVCQLIYDQAHRSNH